MDAIGRGCCFLSVNQVGVDNRNNVLWNAIQNSNEAQITEQLTLRKIIASESAAEDLTFNNLTEIVELDNNVGRYDHGAIPGNQSVYEDAREHDTSGGKDGEIIITPPTGSKQIYYVITAISAVILLAGVYLIKKKVLD